MKPRAGLVTNGRKVMDIREASDYLGISPDTLYKYASSGFVPGFKLGNRWRFKRALLDAWMDDFDGYNKLQDLLSQKIAEVQSLRESAAEQAKDIRFWKNAKHDADKYNAEMRSMIASYLRDFFWSAQHE
jgi:excisionase family DNA binding protein